MAKIKTMKLSNFREDPDNVSEATDAEIARLAAKLKRVPQGLKAMRIAYVTDAGGDGWMVVSGNKRLRCLKAAYGEDGEVPADWFQDITEMSEAERHEFRLNANINDGHFNIDKLLEQYSTEELSDAGLDALLENLVVAAEKEGKTDENAVPDVAEDAPVVSKRGEVYQCGEHRLMCGDSTNAEDVARLMAGEKADMIYTDPPYNVAVGSKNAALNEIQPSNRVTKEIIGDKGMTDEECGEKLWRPAFQNMADNAADHCSIYVSMPQGGTHMMMMMMMRDSWQVKHELMWLKDQPTFSMGRLDYDYKHEPICYGWKKTHRFHGKGQFTKSVWEIPKPRSSKEHPTMKPVELVVNALQNSSADGEIVLDLFGGSGTTLIACEQTNRVARLMELDPHYCDVIRRRWAEFVYGEGCDWEGLTPKVQ